ncbi:MAG: hypothetical protein P4L41_11780 [Flavipsychrobacter sp.]|nr:hypothetical protein [Flavipsychrobacter sp.]
MNIQELRIGNFIKARSTVGQVVAIENETCSIAIKASAGLIEGTYADLAIEPIDLQRDMLVQCCGFDAAGIIKIDVPPRSFYLQENDGHIILMGSEPGSGYLPLIHFWDIKTLHQLQRLYNVLNNGTALPVTLEALAHYFKG